MPGFITETLGKKPNWEPKPKLWGGVKGRNGKLLA